MAPHAEHKPSGTPNGTMVNGDTTPSKSSQSISHILNYPVVKDSISSLDANPYGHKTLTLAHSASAQLQATVWPYAQGPYHRFLEAYFQRADALANSGLDKLDARVPLVKQDGPAIRAALWDSVSRVMPVRLAAEGHAYVHQTWDREYARCRRETSSSAAGGRPSAKTNHAHAHGHSKASSDAMGLSAGLVTGGKAMLATALVITGDSLGYVTSFFQAKKEQGQHAIREKQANGH